MNNYAGNGVFERDSDEEHFGQAELDDGYSTTDSDISIDANTAAIIAGFRGRVQELQETIQTTTQTLNQKTTTLEQAVTFLRDENIALQQKVAVLQEADKEKQSAIELLMAKVEALEIKANKQDDDTRKLETSTDLINRRLHKTAKSVSHVTKRVDTTNVNAKRIVASVKHLKNNSSSVAVLTRTSRSIGGAPISKPAGYTDEQCHLLWLQRTTKVQSVAITNSSPAPVNQFAQASTGSSMYPPGWGARNWGRNGGSLATPNPALLSRPRQTQSTSNVTTTETNFGVTRDLRNGLFAGLDNVASMTIGIKPADLGGDLTLLDDNVEADSRDENYDDWVAKELPDNDGDINAPKL